ncbi:hypothetical protein B0A48_14183 [Cryoendolithus antarcticus]|uniref:Xylanolytic transcriptional activator regulatory domain-containing protein n=1 Tax=Cryoendolithus antarcticus TaxID=1507870 RepID=A0A1V8SLI0_9PEZI|nr:hypothetical protein B0A48_14183 [Cryoendolithus antarcticus]
MTPTAALRPSTVLEIGQRFISDLNPEARFLDRNPTDASYPRGKATDSIGVWVDKDEYEAYIKLREARSAESVTAVIAVPSAPSASQISGLVDVYFRKFNPILPLLDEAAFLSAHSAGSVPDVLLFAICLVAAKDKDAEPFLFDPAVAGVAIPPRDFCHGLYTLIKSRPVSLGQYDRVTLIRLHALLGLYNDGPEGYEGASVAMTMAMHHCQTLGIHLGQQASQPGKDGRPMKLLFWCVWILDRFNAAGNGRPIMMADEDIAIETFVQGESGYPAFEVLLKICEVINRVISFYRPGNPPTVTGWEEHFPAFEEIVEDCAAWDLPSSMLTTLHVAYLSTAILSHRSQGTRKLPNTMPSHVRQTMAATHVIRLMALERLDSLHAFPFLPYTISLAMSVSYQHLRQDQLRHQQEDARTDFEACCRILQQLRRAWASVDAMCTLGQKVLDELKRAPANAPLRLQKPSKEARIIAGFANACRDNEEPVVNGQRNNDVDQRPSPVGADDTNGVSTEIATFDPGEVNQGIFEGMDDIFGTYLDPNYPMNLDDLSFLDDFEPWSTNIT